MFKGKFEDIVLKDGGFLRGPFGSALKKSLFVEKGKNTYKVYEQGVVLQQDKNVGNYYISNNYFEQNLKRFEVKTGDFLVSCSGVNYGAIYQLKGEIEQGVINQALLRIRINKQIIDENFFYYYFKTYIVKKITEGTGDSTIPNFPSMKYIKNIEIELPDIEIQKKIGKLLNNIDCEIQNNNKISMKLEQIAKKIYNYWFLQFEFPNQERKTYKSHGGSMIFEPSLKKEIPNGWKIGKVKDLIELGNGKDYKHLSTGNIPVYGSGGRITNINQYLYNGESILIPRKGTLNNVMYVNEKFWTVDTMFYSKVKIENTAIYTYYSIKLYDFEKLNTGTSVPSMTASIINNLNVLIPSNDILIKFNNIVKPLYDIIHEKIKQNEKLTKLKNYLLPLLMNGQVGFKKTNK